MNLQIKQQEDTEQETYGGKCPALCYAMCMKTKTVKKSVHLACRRSGFDPLSGQTQVIKTNIGSSTAKR